MRWLACLLTGLLLSWNAAFSDDKSTDKLPSQAKWDVSYLEKTWNLKLKSLKYMLSDDKSKLPPSATVTFLFEFTKDVDDLKAVQDAFGVVPTKSSSPAPFLVYFFDEDNVILDKRPIGVRSDTEITGKKGDAFRAYLTVQQPKLYQAAKVEIRPVKTRGKQ